MIPKVYQALIEGLLNKSRLNQLTWMETSLSNEFLMGFAKNGISLREEFDSKTQQNVILFSLYDLKGEKMDSFVATQESDYWEEISEIYTEAKGNFSSVDAAVQSIVDELSQDGKVGR